MKKQELIQKLAEINKYTENNLGNEQFNNGIKYAVKWLNDWILNEEQEKKFANLFKKERR